jgi:tRNA(Arg) A34 adenosine deaminase TadA
MSALACVRRLGSAGSYQTTPTSMCCAAIHWAKLDRVVFSLGQGRLNELSGGRNKPGIRELLSPRRGSPAVIGPIREDEAASIAAQYDWRARRV